MFTICGIMAAGFAATAWIMSYLDSRRDRSANRGDSQRQAIRTNKKE